MGARTPWTCEGGEGEKRERKKKIRGPGGGGALIIYEAHSVGNGRKHRRIRCLEFIYPSYSTNNLHVDYN